MNQNIILTLTKISYVAVGLSNDQKMGASSVMFCYENNNKYLTGMSWNTDSGTYKYVSSLSYIFICESISDVNESLFFLLKFLCK